MTAAIEAYVADMFSQGRFTSKQTEVGYRACLHAHADDVHNRDPQYVGREDIKTTLRRWTHPNSQRKNRSVLVSFYDYLVEEGIIKHNPARQTRRPRARQPQIYRLTRDEALQMLRAAKGSRETRAIHIGILAGLRAQELRGLQGRHFQRDGWIWVDATIAKGSRERWVPVLSELQSVVEDIQATVAPEEYVLPAERWRNPPKNTERTSLTLRPISKQALYQLVLRVGRQAGIAAPVHPHLLRHCYGDHVARFTGVRNAQFLLGHAGIGTTEAYLGKPTLDELREAVQGFRFDSADRMSVLPPARVPRIPREGKSGPVPVQRSSWTLEPSLRLSLPLPPLRLGRLRLGVSHAL